MQALHHHIGKDGFRLRGVEMSRVDAFSDVVFGFALTLLVVSLEVPRTFDELTRSMHGFLPFAICFVLLIQIWYSHFKFFRRYGVHDAATVAINGGLLFVILFYVYPMKFLFSVLVAGWVGGDSKAFGTPQQMRELMILYGVGFAAVFFLLTALYANALRQGQALELTERERFLTRSSMAEYSIMGAVGVLSCVVALVVRVNWSGTAGLCYFLLMFVGRGHARWERARLRRFQTEAEVEQV